MEHVEDKFNDAGAWTEDDTLSREIVDAMYQVYGGGKWQVLLEEANKPAQTERFKSSME
jgi:hypothetical protein